MNLQSKRTKTGFLVAIFLSFCLIVTNLVQIVAASGVSEETQSEIPPAGDMTIKFDTDDYVLKGDTPNEVVSYVSDKLSLVDLTRPVYNNFTNFRFDFNSLIGDVYFVLQNPDGTFSSVGDIEITDTSYTYDASTGEMVKLESKRTVQDFMQSRATLEEALADGVLHKEFGVRPLVPFEGTIGEWLNATRCYIVDKDGNIKLDMTGLDFQKALSVYYTDIDHIDISLVDKNTCTFRLDLKDKDGNIIHQDTKSKTGYIKASQIFAWQDHIKVFSDHNIYENEEDLSWEFQLPCLSDDFDLTIVCSDGIEFKKTLNLADIYSKYTELEPSEYNEYKTPEITISGIPTEPQDDWFNVKISTDVPCKIVSPYGDDLGTTDGNGGTVNYPVLYGNTTYTVIAQPLITSVKSETNSLVTYIYSQGEKEFEISCFSDAYVVPGEEPPYIDITPTVPDNEPPYVDETPTVPDNEPPYVDETPAVSDDYILDLSASSTPVSLDAYANILAENVAKDVIIKSNNGLSFVFAKGTMQKVEGMDSYDFTTSFVDVYADDMPPYITVDNFVKQIIFNYSGKLPAEADISFFVGKQYAGKTLYYSLMNDDKTFSEVQAVTVAVDGYMTVKQSHCSSYVVTSEKPKTADDSQSAVPQTGDSRMIYVYIILGVASAAALFGITRKKYINLFR